MIKLEYLEKSGVLTKQEEKTLADYRLRNGIVAKNVKKECVVGQDYGYGQSQEQYHQ